MRRVSGHRTWRLTPDVWAPKRADRLNAPIPRSNCHKVAKVLAAQPAIEFMVEGHTDSKQLISGGSLMEDNWDLSVKRATTIVRLLEDTYGIDPKRMTAAGRSEYIPVAENNTSENRARNRRTRIVILPQLDQFFQLLEKK